MMKKIAARLYKQSPEQNIKAFARQFSRNYNRTAPDSDSSSFRDNLAKIEQLFSYFTVDNIDEGFISKADFKAHIEDNIGKVDYRIEGFSDDQIAQQRDLSIKSMGFFVVQNEVQMTTAKSFEAPQGNVRFGS